MASAEKTTEQKEKFSDSMTFACTCSARTNESETFVFVCVFTQPDDSRFRRKRHTSLSRHEEQPLKWAKPRASTSAAADEVNTYTYCFVV